MHKIRTIAAAATALVAILYLVADFDTEGIQQTTPVRPPSESGRQTDYRAAAESSTVEPSASVASYPVSPAGTRSSNEPQSVAVEISTGDPGAAAETGWLTYLYPGLADIAESESLPAADALASLQPMLHDHDPVIRLAALEALADLGREAPLSTLTTALADAEPQVRVAALRALTLRRDGAATDSILALAFDPDAEVRGAAVDALAASGDRAAVPTLGALLGDADPAVGRSAIGALGELGGAAAIGYLRQARYHADAAIRNSATAILGEEISSAD